MKDLDEIKRTEDERKEFEDQLDMQILTDGREFSPKKSYMPYQKSYRKLITSLLISLAIALIIGIGGWIYTKENFNSLSNDNVTKVHNAIQFSVSKYYQDNRTYPVDMHGNIDFLTLEKRGYITLDIEVYKSKFIYDSSYNVIRLE